MTTPGPARGRPRSPETDRRILDAALSLLRESGPQALTIESVAATSGVARTTVYRRYENRRELLAACLDQLVSGPLPDPDLPLPAKFAWILGEVAELVENGAGRGVVAAVLTDADPELTAALRARIEERLRTLASLIEQDRSSGALAHWVDPEAVTGVLFGAYLGEALRHGGPRPGWADPIIELLGHALTDGGEPAAGLDATAP